MTTTTRPGRAADGRIVAAAAWPTNAHLIADVAAVHAPDITQLDILDLTPGKRAVWKKRLPDIPHFRELPPGADFRDTGLPAESCDIVWFDPPYVAVGGRHSSTLAASGDDRWDRFGMATTGGTAAAVQTDLINPGVAEAARLTRGQVWVKCQNYTSGGKLWLGVHRTITAMESAGIIIDDIFDMIRPPARQPFRPTQKRAARTTSTLIIGRKPV